VIPASRVPFTRGEHISSLEKYLSYFHLFTDFSDDARSDFFESIKWRILPFQTGTGGKMRSFLACNVSKSIFPWTLASNAAIYH
jgi:hypothetical protein